MIVVIDIAFIVNSYRYLLVGQHSNFIYRVSQNRLHIHTAIKFVTAAALFSQHKMANLAALQLRLRSSPPLSPLYALNTLLGPPGRSAPPLASSAYKFDAECFLIVSLKCFSNVRT